MDLHLIGQHFPFFCSMLVYPVLGRLLILPHLGWNLTALVTNWLQGVITNAMPFNFNYISAFSCPQIPSDFSHSRYELLYTCKPHLFITYMSKSLYVCVCMYIYIYIYMCTHTHTLTYITIEVHNGQLLYKITYNYMLWLVIVSCCHWT